MSHSELPQLLLSERFASSLLPGAAPLAALPLLCSACAPSWCVAPGLSYTSTGPSSYFHVLRWKLLCRKTIPAENKTFVNKKCNLPKERFHRFTCKPEIVVNDLRANPAETLSPSPASSTRRWLVLPLQQEEGISPAFKSLVPPGGLQGRGLVFSSSAARAASPKGFRGAWALSSIAPGLSAE